MTSGQRTIAITGGSGFIGARLMPLMLNKGYGVRVLSRRPHPNVPGITYICGDIRSRDAARTLMQGCSAIIHLAGIAHTTLRTRAERDEAEQINVGGARNLLAAAQHAGVSRVLVASSAHVYAGQEGMGLDEQSLTAGDSFYARTKLLVEQAAFEAAGTGALEVVVVRPCLTYGPGVRFNLSALMRAIRGHYYFHIQGSNPMRSFLSVANAAAGFMHLLEFGESGEVYNLADRWSLPLMEFVNSLADRMHVPRPWTVPGFAIRAAMTAAMPLQRMRLPMPVNHESLRKLMVSFTLDLGRLAATGFQWPDSGLATRMSMVDAYLASCRSSHVTPNNTSSHLASDANSSFRK